MTSKITEFSKGKPVTVETGGKPQGEAKTVEKPKESKPQTKVDREFDVNNDGRNVYATKKDGQRE